MSRAEYRSERHHALDGMAAPTQPDFVDTEPTEDTEQLESIQQSMPWSDMAWWIGGCLASFWAFCQLVNWLAEQAHKHN